MLQVFGSTNYVIIGDPVSVSDSSFSLNEYWNDAKQHNNVGDSSRDEGYLELQWDLPKDMSLAEKFVLRFDELSSIHGINISDNVFKVTKMFALRISRIIYHSLHNQLQYVSIYSVIISFFLREQLLLPIKLNVDSTILVLTE